MISVPTLFLDETRCKRNISKMVSKAKRHQLELRPHFKTHQSLQVGNWFKEKGISKITVSSLKMAAYFAQEWNDITVAFPTNILEIKTINDLAKKIQLNLCIENIEVISFLEKHLESPVGVFIKIDVGTHRTGINSNNKTLINNILERVEANATTNFIGFLGHAGHTYKSRSIEEIETAHLESKDVLLELKTHYIEQYPNLILSAGDTPSCSVSENFEGIDEIRPGNFVFYDLTQSIIGSNNVDEIAVAMACPIVAIHKDRNEIVIYGGGIHFSKDYLEDPNDGVIFGRVVEKSDESWGAIIPQIFLKSLSQEHGIVSVAEEYINNYKVGDVLWVLPVHSCMTADLMKAFYTFDGRVFTML